MSCAHFTDLKTVGLEEGPNFLNLQRTVPLRPDTCSPCMATLVSCNPPGTVGTLAKPRISCDNRPASGDPGGDAEARSRRMRRQTTIAYEKAARLTSAHPRRQFLHYLLTALFAPACAGPPNA